MTEAQMAAIAAIESQQPQKHNTVWMAGEQLKEIASSEPGSAELLAKDLAKADKLRAAVRALLEQERTVWG